MQVPIYTEERIRQAEEAYNGRVMKATDKEPIAEEQSGT